MVEISQNGHVFFGFASLSVLTDFNHHFDWKLMDEKAELQSYTWQSGILLMKHFRKRKML